MPINKCSVISRHLSQCMRFLMSNCWKSHVLSWNQSYVVPIVSCSRTQSSLHHVLQQHGSYMFVYNLSPTDNSIILLHLPPSLIIIIMIIIIIIIIIYLTTLISVHI